MRTQAYKLFDELQHAILKPDKQSARHKWWMSEETLILIGGEILH